MNEYLEFKLVELEQKCEQVYVDVVCMDRD